MFEDTPFLYKLSEEEHQILLENEFKYGKYWKNAVEYNGLLNNFIKEVKFDAMFFVLFISQVKKHHTLSLLSIARKHNVQAQMNFRQVIEATTNAVYGMAHNKKEDFVIDGSDGVIKDIESTKKYKWLEENFKSHSDFLKKQKEIINRGPAHSSTAYAFLNFNYTDNKGFETPFFDNEDEFMTKMQLWFCANLALGIMDLITTVNKKYNLITLIPDFIEQQKELELENHKIKAELGQNERVKRWQKQF